MYISIKPENDFYTGKKWQGMMNLQLLVTNVIHINGSKVLHIGNAILQGLRFSHWFC
jgi:hypothetical protein